MGIGVDCESIGMTIAGSSDDAIEEGSLSVIIVMGIAVEGPGTCRYGRVGCPVNSLKVAPRLLETVVSGTSSEEG